MKIEVHSSETMMSWGEKLGRLLGGGMVVELRGDVGAGKTTLTKGVARGLAVDEDVSSPSFTISRVYDGRDGLTLAHYDFYRLNDPGIMAAELAEAAHDSQVITVVEWGGIVDGVLPEDRLIVAIAAASETGRTVTVTAGGSQSRAVLEALA